jgi:signal transduction histidine kinase
MIKFPIKLRIKALDRYFVTILLVSFIIISLWTRHEEQQISSSTLSAATEQRLASAQILTKTLERDIESGNTGDAWKQLNRGVDHKALIGFLLVDGNGKSLVRDPDTEDLYHYLYRENEWKRVPSPAGSTLEISNSNETMIITEELHESGVEAKSDRIIFLFGIQEVASALRLIHISLVSLLVGLGLATILFFIVLRRAFTRSLILISEGVQQVLRSEEPKIEAGNLMSDYFPSIPFLKSFSKEFESIKKSLQEKVKLAIFGEIAAQVAHDIDSPLAALDGLLVQTQSTQIPESIRSKLQGAIASIRDIAQDLKAKSKEQDYASSEGGEHRRKEEPHLISALLDVLLTEKRTEYRSRVDLEIEFAISRERYGLFSAVNPSEFKRVLSNLVNNAARAIPSKGRIELDLARSGEFIELKIRDNGKGIPSDILPKLGERGETHGNHGGSGLGLYSARNKIKEWNGDLKITSDVGVGTTVTIILPRAPAPVWFLEEIQLRPKQLVVILDDDSSIHGIWKGRFESLHIERREIEVLHFSSGALIKDWYRENESKNKLISFFFDYELLGELETGLDIIAGLGIAKNSVLVTSRYEDPTIRDRCSKLGVKLLPKGMTGFVSISCLEPRSQRYDAVFIDNDPTNLRTWAASARLAEKSLLTFTAPEKFFEWEWALSFDSPVYVDHQLGEGILGSDVSKKIVDLGFHSVYLAAGYPERFNLEEFFWLKGIRGKLPPWED